MLVGLVPPLYLGPQFRVDALYRLEAMSIYFQELYILAYIFSLWTYRPSYEPTLPILSMNPTMSPYPMISEVSIQVMPRRKRQNEKHVVRTDYRKDSHSPHVEFRDTPSREKVRFMADYGATLRQA